MFFQLPAVVSGTSQITAASGTGIDAATPVTFSEFSDNGTGAFASPFAPSNVIGTMNADGSEIITWQNNDNSSPIYIYVLVSGTWEVTGTLAAGTTTYTASASTVGSVEIGNNFSPGGSSGNNPAGGKPATDPFNPIPVQSYAAIDISGTSVNAIALDDSNNAAFVYFTGVAGSPGLTGSSPAWFGYLPGYAHAFQWSNGSLGSEQLTNLSATPAIPYTHDDGPYSYNVDYTFVDAVDTAGIVFGFTFYASSEDLDACSYWGSQPQGQIQFPSYSGGGTSTLFILPYPFATPYSDPTALGNSIRFTCLSPDGSYGAEFNTYGDSAGFYDADGSWAGGIQEEQPQIIVTNGNFTLFDPETDYSDIAPLPSNLTIEALAFFPSCINDPGSAVGYDGSGNAVFWQNGASTLTELSPMEDVIALNNQNQVIGSTGTSAYIWTSSNTSCVSTLVTNGTAQVISPSSSFIPQQYHSELANIGLIDISGSDSADGSVRILFSAQYQSAPNAGPPPSLGGTSAGWSAGTFVLTLESGTLTTLAQAIMPSNVTGGFSNINAQGITAAIGNITTGTGSAAVTGSNHALLLLPVQLKQTNYPTTAGEVDPGVSGTETISSGTTSNSVAYITGSAAMPMLQVEIANGSLSGMQVQWWMMVTSERPERGTQDNLQIPALEPGYVTIPINQPWEIDDYYPEPFGGICTIHYIIQDSSGNNLTPAQTFPFLIRGKNPTPTEAHNYIQAEPGGTTTYYYAWGVAKHESAQDTYNAIYCQFNAGGPTLALPNYGYPNGWGIFQRDDTGGGIPVTTDQVYSWKVNSDVSVQQELPQKWNGANNYLNGLSTQYSTQYGQDPPPTYTTGNGTVFAAIDTLTMEAYNGAGTYSHLLTFYPSNAHGHRWAWHLPNAPKDTERYVDRVAERMSTSP